MSKEEKVQKETVISHEIALNELTGFLKKHKSKEFRRGKMTPAKIAKDYIDVIEAIEDGLLFFEDSNPTYTLKNPIFEEAKDKNNVIKTVTFRTRIKKADLTRVMDGLDIEQQRGTYVLKLIGYITQLKEVEYNRLENDDFDVLNQICSVF